MGKKKQKKKARAREAARRNAVESATDVASLNETSGPATGATPGSTPAGRGPDVSRETSTAAPTTDPNRDTDGAGLTTADRDDVASADEASPDDADAGGEAQGLDRPAADEPPGGASLAAAPPVVPGEPAAPTAWPIEDADEPVRARRADPVTPATPTGTTGPRRAAPRDTLPRPQAAPRVLVVANQKGGVGKTTTAVNVAAALALGGLRVLLIDLDPQGNASTALGVEHGPDVAGTYEALIDGQEIGALVRTSPEADTLQVLPASIHLAGAEIQLVGMVARENKLAKAIRKYVRDHDVDYIFLDCPPSLGLLTVNALVAADEIMIPIQCEYYALEGVSQLMNTIELVKGELNDELNLSTVLLTMFDARTRLAAQVVDEVRTHFAAETLAAVIPRSVRISEAPSYGRTVMTYDPESTGARSYHAAATEIAHRGARP